MAVENQKIVDMKADDVRALMKPVGLPGLPYPMAMLKKGEKGTMEHDVGVIDSATNPLVVYTDQDVQRVNGMLFRQMPIPGMMFMLRDLLAKIAPDSKNRIMTVLGDAAFGKSHLFKLVGGMTHPDGPISVDCGGMNMREIFFRTVIDYGQGVKEQFEKRLANGQISQSSIDSLNAEFPGAIVQKAATDQASMTRIDSGTLTPMTFYVDWDAIGKPKQETKDGKTTNVEDRGDAARRAASLMEAIYKKEGIDAQSNAFGIKTVPGEAFESLWTGRPLFLDEFNKSKKGTLDAFQTFLQFANGEIDTCRIENPMATAGDKDSPKYMTINRSDVRMGWFIGVAGNDSSDGDTTQELSTSMLTRLNPMRIGQPSLRDWSHRISQIWTGLPLTTIYNLFEKEAKANPVAFSKFLVDLRELGLSPSERKAIPPHERYFLQNFQDTYKAINQVSKYYNDRLQLSNPDSEMFNRPEYRNLANEVAAYGDNIFVSFRKPIDDFNKTVQGTPDVRPATDSKLSLDLSEVFKSVDLSAVGRTMPAWHKFGANMARVIQEGIANDTLRMPLTNAALITMCQTNGIVPADLKEAKPGKDVVVLADLLKYDALKDLGGTEELRQVQSVLMACLKNLNPSLKAPDDNVIPLDKLGSAIKDLKAQGNPGPKSFVVPNEDLNAVTGKPLVVGQALPNYLLDDPTASKDFALVDFRTALAALAVPGYADDNRKHMWPVDLDDYLPDDVKADAKSDPSQGEAMNTIKGNSSIGFNLVVLAAKNEKNEPVYLYVIDDKDREKMMIVGPQSIAPALQSELARNGIEYVVKSEESSQVAVNEFLAAGAKFRGSKGVLVQGATQNVIEGLIKAFSALCELTDTSAGATPDQMTVEKGATLGLVMFKSKSKPAVFTSIVTPKAGRR